MLKSKRSFKERWISFYEVFKKYHDKPTFCRAILKFSKYQIEDIFNEIRKRIKPNPYEKYLRIQKKRLTKGW